MEISVTCENCNEELEAEISTVGGLSLTVKPCENCFSEKTFVCKTCDEILEVEIEEDGDKVYIVPCSECCKEEEEEETELSSDKKEKKEEENWETPDPFSPEVKENELVID